MRVDNAQDAPVAVTALTAKTIARQVLTSNEKIAARTSNLNVGRASNGSGAQLTQRGIGSSSTSTSIGVEQSGVDGVYFGHGRITHKSFFGL